jgi:hypothetical protein
MFYTACMQDERLAAGRSVVRLPCRRRIRRDVLEQSSHDSDQETGRPGTLKSSSSECEETKPLMAANRHTSSYSGRGSSTNHGSFVSSVNSTEGEDFNNIHLLSPAHGIIN